MKKKADAITFKKDWLHEVMLSWMDYCV